MWDDIVYIIINISNLINNNLRDCKLSSNIYMAVGKMLKPVKATLDTIIAQLDGIQTTLNDLTIRIEEIEKMMKAEKTTVV